MALLHHKSAECMKSELNLFAIPDTQAQMIKGSWVDYQPSTTITENSPIEFVIPPSEYYIDLANTQLYVRVKIVKADGTPLDEDSVVGPCNLFFHAIFAQIDVFVHDRLISGSSNTNPYKGYLVTFFNFSDDAKTSWLTSEMWYKDTAGQFDACTEANKGYAKRAGFFKKSASVEMLGPLHIDLHNQERYMLNNTSIRYRLLPSKSAFCLMSSTPDAGFKVIIEDAELMVRKVQISSSTQLGHATGLQAATAKYVLDRTELRTYSMAKGTLNFTRDNLFPGQLPRRIMAGLVDSRAMNGNYAYNPFNFKNYNLNFLAAYVNGEQLPFKPLEPDFKKGLYLRSYNTLGALAGREGHGIDREEYPNGFALYHLDFRPDVGPSEGYLNLVRQGSLRLELRFAEALPETVNLIIFAEFETILEINKDRHVIYDS